MGADNGASLRFCPESSIRGPENGSGEFGEMGLRGMFGNGIEILLPVVIVKGFISFAAQKARRAERLSEPPHVGDPLLVQRQLGSYNSGSVLDA